jgi:hypothetical protein
VSDSPPPASNAPVTDAKALADSKALFDYLKFAQEQIEADRKQFTHLFDRTIKFMGFLIVVAGGLLTWSGVTSFRTLQDAVLSRVDNEFRTENITQTVTKAAKDYAAKDLEKIIRSETSKAIKNQDPAIRLIVERDTRQAVKALEPTIKAIVDEAVAKQVQTALIPVETRVKELGPWDLTPDQSRILSDALDEVGPGRLYLITSNGLDSERMRAQVVKLFQSKGWIIQAIGGGSAPRSDMQGIICGFHSDRKGAKLRAAYEKAFGLRSNNLDDADWMAAFTATCHIYNKPSPKE